MLDHATATTFGTPRAESWDDAWLACVDETEQRLARRICGAHAPDGEPCELGSTHPNGRCRFHGGHPRIGAQPGNTNALIHGLYSRRLRQCNNTCPVWHMCPFAGPDVMALSERKRPVCAYEREAYAIGMRLPEMEWSAAKNCAAVLSEDHATLSGAGGAQQNARGPLSDSSNKSEKSDPSTPPHSLPIPLTEPGKSTRESLITQLQYRATPFFNRKGATTRFPRTPDGAGISYPYDPSAPYDPSVPSTPPPDPTPAIIEDTGAILYAMLQRATLTVSAHQLTEKTEAEGERYTFRTTKMSAALNAFLRIGRELRAWLKLRPTSTAAAAEQSGFGDSLDRPEHNEHGYQQFYDHKGNKIGLPALMHPFLHELDAAVEQLRKEGIKIPPPQGVNA